MIQREMLQDSYEVEFLASSNSEDNDSEEDDDYETKLTVRLKKVVSSEIEPTF
jgi:hypothetical protein